MKSFRRSWLPIWLGTAVLLIGVRITFSVYRGQTIAYTSPMLDAIFLVPAGLLLLAFGARGLREDPSGYWRQPRE